MKERSTIMTLMLCAAVLSGSAIDRAVAAESPSGHATRSVAPTNGPATQIFGSRITQYPVSNPGPAALGPDGNVWVGDDQLVRVTPSGRTTRFDIGNGGPIALTSAFGKLWFAAGTFTSPYVARMDVASGKIVRFFLSPGHCLGSGITPGPDGNIWFTDSCGPSIVRMTPGGTMTAFPIPNGRQAHYIIAGPDGKLWFTIDDSGAFGKIDTSGNISIVPLQLAFLPRGLVLASDGNVYIYDTYHAFLYRVTAQNAFTKYQAGLPLARNVVVAEGADHRVWMLSAQGQLQSFDPARGKMSNVISLPGQAIGASGIVAGSDGDLWFTAGAANYVGVFEL